MAGYVIHVAIANEYIKKNYIENKDEFVDGVIAPDRTDDKIATHYGDINSRTDLKRYLSLNSVDADYQKGYFLHLLTDYLFYNYYFITPEDFYFYDDYDKTNKELISKYDVTLPDDLKQYMHTSDGEPEYLKIDLVEKMIEEISSLKLEEVAETIMKFERIVINDKKIMIN